jgi:hypothetical protein
MNFKNVKQLYVLSCIVLCLIFLSPTLALIVHFPEGETFSELWVLGATHQMEDYPFSVSQGVNYHIFLGVANQMGSLEHYSVRVKLRNQSEPMPDNLAGTSSELPTIYEYRLFLCNNATWETEFSFSLSGVSFEGSLSKISTFSINGYPINVDKIALSDERDNGFYYELFFELWIYNSTTSTFQFDNRNVGFWINLNR